uniref:Phosphatidylinositol transfer protein N-terminal domain-containing protein n=1 Tax=Gopherus agassizii TaxID=38772 RepID=A0A452I5J8_9SAUR
MGSGSRGALLPCLGSCLIVWLDCHKVTLGCMKTQQPFLGLTSLVSLPGALLSCDHHAVGAEYTCSFLPKFSIYIETKYEDNCGDNANIFLSDKVLGNHEVTFLDIAFDEIPERYYQSPEDLRYFSSMKTGRGPLREGWQEHTEPIMCSYKLVTVKFEVWGLQTRVEQFVHKVIRDILLIGHRQAFAWIDEWCDMPLEEVRAFETQMQVATNQKFRSQDP